MLIELSTVHPPACRSRHSGQNPDKSPAFMVVLHERFLSGWRDCAVITANKNLSNDRLWSRVLRLVNAELATTREGDFGQPAPALILNRAARHLPFLHVGEEGVDVIAHQ